MALPEYITFSSDPIESLAKSEESDACLASSSSRPSKLDPVSLDSEEPSSRLHEGGDRTFGRFRLEMRRRKATGEETKRNDNPFLISLPTELTSNSLPAFERSPTSRAPGSVSPRTGNSANCILGAWSPLPSTPKKNSIVHSKVRNRNAKSIATTQNYSSSDTNINSFSKNPSLHPNPLTFPSNSPSLLNKIRHNHQQAKQFFDLEEFFHESDQLSELHEDDDDSFFLKMPNEVISENNDIILLP